MLRRMLGVDGWLDVASLKNVEEDHSFLFLKKNSMEIFFFFLIWKSWIFSRNWKFWLVIFLFFFFFVFEKQPKKYEPNALSPKALFENFLFLFLFFFWKFWKSWIFEGIWKNLIDEIFFFFVFWKWPKKYEPNAPSPKAFFENFLLLFFFFFEKFGSLEFFHGIENFWLIFFFFLKNLEILNFFKELKILIGDFFSF